MTDPTAAVEEARKRYEDNPTWADLVAWGRALDVLDTDEEDGRP